MSTVPFEQQIIEIIEMLIPFKCNFTSSKGLKNRLKNIDLERLLGELKQPSAEPPHEKVVEIKRYMKSNTTKKAMKTPPAAPLNMVGLRLNALSIVAWVETLAQITDQDSPAAVAIREHINVSLNYMSRILVLGKPAEYAEENDEYRTLFDIRDILPPEKFAEVNSYISDLWQESRLRFGDPTAKRER